MRKKKHLSAVEIRSFSKGTNIIFNILFIIVALSCVLPFFFIIVLSLTKESDITAYGYQFWPKNWSIASYQYLADMKDQLLTSFGTSIFITIVGTIMNSFFSSTYAYAISRNDFAFAKFFTIFALVSMLFTPGMVPTYLIVTQMLNLKDNIWAIILPQAFGVYNVLIMRTYFKTSISESILESARVDGAGELKIFWTIVVPLAIPGIATISLFTCLSLWNDWFNAMLYLTNTKLIPLQYLLVQIQDNIQYMTQAMSQGASTAISAAQIPSEGMKFAVVVISTLPIALTYPFFQKYFVKGMQVGGVKG